MPRLTTGVNAPPPTFAPTARRLISLLAALTVGLLSIVVFTPAAYACSCGGLRSQSAAQRADAVFVGRLVDKQSRRKPTPGRVEMRFDVSLVYKGSVYRQQVVASLKDADGCGIDPEINSTWVIFAEETVQGSGDDAVFRLVTQLCSGNIPGGNAPIILGVGRPPIAGASDREENAASTDATFTRVLQVGVGVAGGLVLVVGFGLAYLWNPGRRGS